ncbi:MAG: 30S ribosomal protein S4 [Candidatus Hadarchaeum sp.]|uniref:30S ribosomal protein S4 n=1 Tax=Candidatus Hadarchaeum sp. TaxID=2883567 RepID=UPI003D09F0FD
MKRQRKKYLRPSHPWEKNRMDAEDAVLAKFGLRRKEEIWRAQTLLRNFRRQARDLLAASGPQAEKETKQLIVRLQSLGLVGENATLDDVLGLTVEKLLERRLQTVVHRKGLAQSMSQARQLITHGHIAIAGRRVNVPSYLVSAKEEPLVGYASGKPFTEGKLGSQGPSEPVKASGEEGTIPDTAGADEHNEEGEN